MYSSALAGIHVLVVDDDQDMCIALQFLLESYGAEVRAAFSGADALAAIACSRPDVLLSDVVMPHESGYDLMRKITARDGSEAPPAAALSAYAKESGLRQATAAGFRTLLPKPVQPMALLAVVAGLAGRRLPAVS